MELLPCPFCGGSELLRRHTPAGVSIVCDECGAEGPHSENHAEDWNRRHTPAAWQTVPVEPTEEMKHVADIETPGPMTAWKCWQVMLAAAPRPGGGE